MKFVLSILFFVISQNAGAVPAGAIGLSKWSDLNELAIHQTLAQPGVSPIFFDIPSYMDLDGRPVLHYISERGHIEALKTFLRDNVIDIDKRDSFLNTALHYVAWKNSNNELMAFLLSKGADPNAENHGGETPLHLAAKNRRNSEAVIQLLLQAGAKPKKKTKTGENVLHYMAKYNQSPKAFKALLPYKERLLVGDDKRNNPLHSWMIESSGNLAVLKMLLQFQPNFLNIKNQRGETAVHLGMKNEKLFKNVEMIEIFQDFGADFHARDLEGNTPLHLLVQNKGLTLPFLLALFSVGADPMAENEKGETPLHLAAKYNENVMIIMAFEKMGVDFNVRDKKGNTPLHLAAAHNRNPGLLKAILSFNGGNIDLRNDSQERPSHLAAEFNKNSGLIDFLKAQGADFNLKDEKGRNILHRISKANEHFLKNLLERNQTGLEINTPDNEGETAFHHAVRSQFRPKVLSAFLQAGADPDIANKRGETPRDLLNNFLSEGEAGSDPQIHNCLKAIRGLL